MDTVHYCLTNRNLRDCYPSTLPLTSLNLQRHTYELLKPLARLSSTSSSSPTITLNDHHRHHYYCCNHQAPQFCVDLDRQPFNHRSESSLFGETIITIIMIIKIINIIIAVIDCFPTWREYQSPTSREASLTWTARTICQYWPRSKGFLFCHQDPEVKSDKSFTPARFPILASFNRFSCFSSGSSP